MRSIIKFLLLLVIVFAFSGCDGLATSGETVQFIKEQFHAKEIQEIHFDHVNSDSQPTFVYVIRTDDNHLYLIHARGKTIFQQTQLLSYDVK